MIPGSRVRIPLAEIPRQLLDEVRERLWTFTASIFAVDGDHPSYRGTATCVTAGGAPCLLTAAHVWNSLRGERFGLSLPLGEGHLRRLVHEYVAHYHDERNHQGLGNRLLQRAPPPVRSDTDVQRRVRLGGLLSFYHREAA